MARECKNEKCHKHHVRLRGASKYCPVCGEATFAIPAFPFYIYVSQKGCLWIAGSILAGVLLVYAGK